MLARAWPSPSRSLSPWWDGGVGRVEAHGWRGSGPPHAVGAPAVRVLSRAMAGDGRSLSMGTLGPGCPIGRKHMSLP